MLVAALLWVSGSAAHAASSLSPASATIAPTAGSSSFTISPAAAWTATSSASWLTVSSASGTSGTAISYSWTANTSTAARMAAIVVNGLVFNVLQVGTTGLYTPWGTTSGEIVTVAGNGTLSFGGDGGAATSAYLGNPGSVAVDHNGNIFIADNSNYRIRRVDAITGVISTYAGGGCCFQDGVAATQNSLSSNLSIALDQAGDLFIADGNAQRIRRVDVTTGIISTVAGNGSSGFGADNVAATSTSLTGPVGLTVDAQGNIYFNDSQAYRIRRVDGTTGLISTVAGTGISGYSGDNGLATQAQISANYIFSQVAVDSSGNIFFSDSTNNRIRRIDATTLIITTFAGGGGICCSSDSGVSPLAVNLSNPSGLAFDGSGNLYISDGYYYAVRRIDAVTGLLSTVAGTGGYGFSGDGGPAAQAVFRYVYGLATDGSGNVYIADNNNSRVRFVDEASPRLVVSPATPNVPSSAGSGSLSISAPSGVFWAATTNTAWLNLNTSSGTGTGAATYTYVANNTSPSPRTGFININGISYAVLQAGTTASLSAASLSVAAAAGNGTVTLTTGANTAWTATSSASWLTVLPASGTGGISLAFSFTANTGAPARTATLTIAGQLFRVTQIGATSQYTPWITSGFGQIQTIAGTGSSVHSGDGGAATAAGLHPNGIALDGNGNVYVLDTYNPCCSGLQSYVRLISASTGLITTVTGNGASGFSGDGGLATQASLNDATAIAVDGAGNLYIADTSNYRVRKVNVSTGIISTIAGNGIQGYSGDGAAATAAELGAVTGLAVDNWGNVFFSDSSNNVVRRIDSASGIITTVAGNLTAGFSGDGGAATSASLHNPLGLALDHTGNLYITDEGNNRIRRVDAVTGMITSVVGNGCCGSLGDGGPATAALLSYPNGVTLDAAGNLFISETNKIRRVDAITGVITTVAGNGSNGYNGDGIAATVASMSPYGVAVDSSGNIYIADAGNYRVRFVDNATPVATLSSSRILELSPLGSDGISLTVAGSAAWSAVSSATWLTVTNSSGFGSATISFAFTANTSLASRQATITVLGHTATVIQGGVTAALSASSTIAMGTAGSGSVSLTLSGSAPWTASAGASWLSVSPTSGSAGTTLTISWTANSGTNSRTGQVQVGGQTFTVTQLGSSGNYTAWGASGYGQIHTIAGNGAGSFSGDLGAATAASLYNPAGVAADSSGNVYIADTSNNRIRKVNAGTGIISTFAGNGSSGFSGDGGSAFSAQLSYPRGVAVDATGNLFIADSSNYRIRRVDAVTGIITTVAGNGGCCSPGDGGLAIAAGFYPQGVALDISGNLYIADSNYSSIRKVDAVTHLISTVAGTGSSGYSGDGGVATAAALNDPLSVAVDSNGNIFIADFYNRRVRRVDAGSGIITTIAGIGGSCCGGGSFGGSATSVFLSPQAVAVDTSGNLLVADGFSDRNGRVNLTTGIISLVAGTSSYGFSGDGGPATAAQVNAPAGVAADGNGNVYIADTNNQRIRFVDFSSPQITLTNTFTAAPATAGTGSIGLTISPAGALWTASSSGAWLTVTTPSGTGAGSIGFSYTANTSTASRSALITVDGQTAVVVQGGVSVSLSAPSATVTAAAGSGTFNITTSANWTATSNAGWLTVGTPSGSGSGTINYSFTANSGTNARSAAITIAGQTFTVLQRGTSGGYSIWGPSAGGTIVTIAGNGSAGFSGDGGLALSATLRGPRGTTVDRAGNVFIADSSNSRVRRLDVNSRNISTVAGSSLTGYFGDGGPATSAALSIPVAVSVDSSGNLYIGDTSASNVRRVDGTTGTITTVNQSTASLSDYAVVNDPGGNLYIADTANNRVLRWDVSSGLTTVLAGTGVSGFGGDNGPASQAQLWGPQGLAMDTSGNLYIADTINYRIRMVSATSGIITTVAGGGSYYSDGVAAIAALIVAPGGLAVDPSGNLYIGSGYSIRRVDAATKLISTVAGTGSSGFSGDGGPARSASISNSFGISVDGLGNLYIPDNSNNRVRFVDMTSPAGPVITSVGNGADYSSPPLAPGSLGILYGTSLAPSAVQGALAPAAFSLGGVTVTVNGTAAPIQSVSPTQINFVLPFGTTTGTASVVVSYNGVTSNTFMFSVGAADPGIFYIANTDGSTNSLNSLALPSTLETIYFSGAGATTPSVADGAVAPASPLAIPNATVTVTVGGVLATLQSVSLAPGAVGLAQAVINVPPSLIPGSYNVVVTAGGRSSTAKTIYVGGPTPVITSISPGYVVAGGAGFTATLIGANLTAGSIISWTPPGGGPPTFLGTVQSAQIQIAISSTLISAPGTAQISILNPVGARSNSIAFIIAPFAITGSNPTYAQVGSSNTPIIISGSNLGTAATMNFIAPGGAVSSIPLSLVQSAQASATLPSSTLTSAGTAQLALLNSSGAVSNSISFYVTPFTLNTVAPATIPVGSSATTVTINGQNLSTAAHLFFTPPGGQATSVPLGLIQAAQLTASLPANLLTSAGTAQIAVADGNGAISNILNLPITSFTINSVTPNSVSAGSAATSVTVSGTNLSGAASLYFITPGGVPVPLNPSLIQAAQVQATLPAALMTSGGTAQIALADPNGALSNELPFTIVSSVPVLISATGQSGFAGQNIQIPIQLSLSGSPSPAGFQADLTFDSTKLTFVSVTAGTPLTAASKTISTSPISGGVRLLASGVNQNAIGAGTIAYATFAVKSSFPQGTTSLTVANCVATDASGNTLTTGCGNPVTVQTPSNCDINSSQTVDVSDVQMIINEVLGVSPAVHDLNHDGNVNIADVQIVINSVLGLGCPAP